MEEKGLGMVNCAAAGGVVDDDDVGSGDVGSGDACPWSCLVLWVNVGTIIKSS